MLAAFTKSKVKPARQAAVRRFHRSAGIGVGQRTAQAVVDDCACEIPALGADTQLFSRCFVREPGQFIADINSVR
jgi:hypothetical protein